VQFFSRALQHEQELSLLVFVLRVDRKTGYFHEAGEGVIAQVIGREHHDQFVNEVRVDDVVHWDPAEESVESLEARTKKRGLGLMHIFEDQLAEFENGCEVLVHLGFELLNLELGHLVFGVVEDLLAQHLQDVEVIFTDVEVVY
jgi:hypothetical protein